MEYTLHGLHMALSRYAIICLSSKAFYAPCQWKQNSDVNHSGELIQWQANESETFRKKSTHTHTPCVQCSLFDECQRKCVREKEAKRVQVEFLAGERMGNAFIELPSKNVPAIESTR